MPALAQARIQRLVGWQASGKPRGRKPLARYLRPYGDLTLCGVLGAGDQIALRTAQSQSGSSLASTGMFESVGPKAKSAVRCIATQRLSASAWADDG
jgi:hypothetical protein